MMVLELTKFLIILALIQFSTAGKEDLKVLLNRVSPAAHNQWYSQCSSPNGVGTCMKRSECVRLGGTPSGQCDVNQAGMQCCTIILTGTATSSLKRTILRRPTVLNELQLVYTIQATTTRVCQLRIDFTDFRLAFVPPIAGQNSYPQCDTDVFIANNNFFRLCGDNSQQHIYVPFNATNGVTSIDLRINLADRTQLPNLIVPDWNILVTQLECPQGGLLRAGMRAVDFDQEINPNQIEPRIWHNPRNYFNDAYWIAPVGCLQYHPAPSGIIESFNYGNGLGPYLGAMQYAICIRKTASDQQMTLTQSRFQMAVQDSTIQAGFDEDCLPQIQTIGRSEDYLMIPGATVHGVPDLRATRFCSNSIDGSTVSTSLTGPIVLYFNSDTEYQQPLEEIGFRIGYQIN